MLAFVVLASSVSLVVAGPVGQAAATTTTYPAPPQPITQGPDIRSAPQKTLKFFGRRTPVGMLINGAQLLYSTQDSWLPILKGEIGPGNDSDPLAGGDVDGCPAVGVFPLALSAQAVAVGTSPTPNGVAATWTRGNVTCGAGTNGFDMHFQSVSCETNGVVVRNTSFNGNTSVSGNASKTFIATLCAPGSTIAQVNVWSSKNGVVNSNQVFLTGPVPDSLMEQTATIQCRQPDGSLFEISATITGQPERVYVPSCAERVPGSIPWSGNVSTGITGGHSQPEVEFETDTTEWNKYEDCFNEVGLVCKIRVFINGEACTVGDLACRNWQDYAATYPQRVECRFGSHVVALSQCAPLKHAYKGVKTITEVDPAGYPQTDPDPQPQPSPTPAPTPQPAPTTGPNPTGPEVVVTPETDPDGQGCFGQMWSWNPVDWVYVPVKCSLLWAFKPKTSITARWDGIKTEVMTKAPFSWFSGFLTVPAGVPFGDCPDWTVKVGDLQKNVVCDSTYTDAIRSARPVLLAFMVTLALWPLLRSTAYAAFPILKPSPGMLR